MASAGEDAPKASKPKMGRMITLLQKEAGRNVMRDASDGGGPGTLPFIGGTGVYVRRLRSSGQLELVPPGTAFFRDGVRRVDFVLVWEEGDSETDEVRLHTRQRRVFEAWLRRAKIQMQVETSPDGKIHFVLLHAPFGLLLNKAEEMHEKMPVRVYDDEDDQHFSQKICGICGFDPFDNGLDPKPLEVSNTFTKAHMERYLNYNIPERFFSPCQRARIVHHILTSTRYGEKTTDIGIEQLVENGSYAAAFPLHEGDPELPANFSGDEDELSARQVLLHYWSRWACWRKYQPLDRVKDYFGTKIAIYFAWLGFYTAWLLPPAVLGVIIFVISIFTMLTSEPIKEVCHSNMTMCPFCNGKGCHSWNLKSACGLFKAEHLFDNGGTVFFAVFMALWATLFLEFWKRKTAVLAHRWNVMDYEETEEPIRAKFAIRATDYEPNPITQVMEPAMKPNIRYPRYFTGFSILTLMVGMIAISIIGVMVYRTLVSRAFGRSNPGGKQLASLSASVLQVIVIIILSKIYSKLALWLTEWENHRTESEFEDHLTLKMFLFEFANYYSSIFYIAFFKGRWLGHPPKWSTNVFGFHPEHCGAAGCMMELAQQLAIIMVGKQIINNVLEFLTPLLKKWWAARQARKHAQAAKAAEEEEEQDLVQSAELSDSGSSRRSRSSRASRASQFSRSQVQAERVLPQWEQDYILEEDEGLFGEYLEMVLQFGFITIFVAAFPLAPLFALLNNWIEIRLDANNYVTAMRRPVPEVAQDIGIWFTILDILVKIAIICSAFIIAFTSSFIDRVYYQFHYNYNLKGFEHFVNSKAPKSLTHYSYECWYKGQHNPKGGPTMDYWHLVAIRVAFVLVFEHVAFIVANIMDLLVPDIPRSLEVKIKKEQYHAQRELDRIEALRRKEESEDDVYSGEEPL